MRLNVSDTFACVVQLRTVLVVTPYWESFVGAFSGARIELPAGCSVFPNELYRAPRSWCESHMPNLIHWNKLDRGGHFAAFEVPDLFISEVRSCFGKLRRSRFAA